MSNGELSVLTVCGYTKTAHIVINLAAYSDMFKVRSLILDKELCNKFRKDTEEGMKTLVHRRNASDREMIGKPSVVTSDPRKGVAPDGVVVLAVPVSEQEEYLRAITPRLEKAALIIAIPSGAGFECLCREILGPELFELINVISCDDIPWHTKGGDVGKNMEVVSIKENIVCSLLTHRRPKVAPFYCLQVLLGERPTMKPTRKCVELNLLSNYLATLNPVFLYLAWKDLDGKSIASQPGLYKEVTEEQAQYLSELSEEIVRIAVSINEQHTGAKISNVTNLQEWLMDTYSDDVYLGWSVRQCLADNESLAHSLQPMVEQSDGTFLPDFQCDILLKDLPNGLVAIKGISVLAGTKTPNIDEVILWCQGKTGKEYIIDGDLTGKDVKETRCPQRFNVMSLDELMQIK